MSFNHSKLRGKIKEVFGTQEKFAHALEMSSASLSAKLNGSSEFGQEDIAKAMKLLSVSTDDAGKYFFDQKVQ